MPEKAFLWVIIAILAMCFSHICPRHQRHMAWPLSLHFQPPITMGPRLVVAIASRNTLGRFISFFLAKCFRLLIKNTRTVSVEFIMQNSTPAVSLANDQFENPLTVLPSAISATIPSFSGSSRAGNWRVSHKKKNENATRCGPSKSRGYHELDERPEYVSEAYERVPFLNPKIKERLSHSY